MRPLPVNFVMRRSFWPWAGYGLSMGLGVLTAVQAWATWEQLNQRRAAESELALPAGGGGSKSHADSVAGTANEPVYAQDANALGRLASFDAGRVLASLESARVMGVKVTAVEVSAAEQTARVELEVNDPASILQILEQLNVGNEGRPVWRLVRAQSPASSALGSATIEARAVIGLR